MKNFKIIIELNEAQTIFESANTEEKIDKIINNYLPNLPQSVKVYKLDKANNQYALTFQHIKRIETEHRLIGFGRW